MDNASTDGSAQMARERFPPGSRASVLGWLFLGGLVSLEQVGRGAEEQG